MVKLAQLVRASDCGSEGRGFETHISPTKRRLRYRSLLFFVIPAHNTPTEPGQTGPTCPKGPKGPKGLKSPFHPARKKRMAARLASRTTILFGYLRYIVSL